MTGDDCEGYRPTLHHMWVIDVPITDSNHMVATDIDDDRDILNNAKVSISLPIFIQSPVCLISYEQY